MTYTVWLESYVRAHKTQESFEFLSNLSSLIVFWCVTAENLRIYLFQEKALQLVYTFEQLLEKDKAFTIHGRNLQKLAVKVYNVKNYLCPRRMKYPFVPYREKKHS